MSHQSISYLLTALKSAIAKMTSWRDVQEAGLGAARRLVLPESVAVMGADETVLKVKGKQTYLLKNMAAFSSILEDALLAQCSDSFFA